MPSQKKPVLFFDIGGVLLTNGWDHSERRLAAERFGLDRGEFEERHRAVSALHETGRISLDDYLRFAVFYTARPFTPADFKEFMFSRSEPRMGMIELVREIREKHSVRTASLNNEGRELNAYRIRKFRLDEIIDVFISSCFVHTQKPDPGMFLVALDFTQALPERSIYIEDRSTNLEVAASLGFNCVRCTDYRTTRDAVFELLAKLGA